MNLNKTIFILILTLLATITARAANSDLKDESDRRLARICDLYSQDHNDSLIAQVPLDLAFDREHGFWDNYYETWMHLVNTYTFMGQVNTALSEVKQMHSDAEQRKYKYGTALANYAMGNAYNNMGYLDESILCYEQSMKLIQEANVNPTTANDIYSYYCDALYLKKDFEAIKRVTDDWRNYLDRMMKTNTRFQSSANHNVWWAYYYLACAQRDLGLNALDAAERDINAAEELKNTTGEFIAMSVLYYRAQLFLQRGDYQQALYYNNIRNQKSESYDDKSSLVLIREQRAQILSGLGQYEEAMQMYKSVYQLTDSIYKKDTRTQINELNTLFRVNELDMEKRLERTRMLTLIIVIIVIAMALLSAYWLMLNRRLRRKNEELAVALDRAQESDRMKSAFIHHVSHEIRTPLNIITGFTRVLNEPGFDVPEAERKDMVERIDENTRQITDIVNALLELSATESTTAASTGDEVTVADICQQAIRESGVQTTDKVSFSLLSDAATDQLRLHSDADSMVKILKSLLTNAVKFTDEGTITLQARYDDSQHQFRFTVTDTGVGISPEAQERIFDTFEKVDTFREGIGLGLSVSRALARRLGGDVVLLRSDATGSSFELYLPAKLTGDE